MTSYADSARLSRRILLAILGLAMTCALLTVVIATARGLVYLPVANAVLLCAYAGLAYFVAVVRPQTNLKPHVLSAVSAHCLVTVFAVGTTEVQLAPLVMSLVMWLLMYHEPRALRLIGGTHVGLLGALVALAPSVESSVPWLTVVVFAFVLAAFTLATLLTIQSNRRYWERMKRLELELGRNESSLRETAGQLRDQHDELSAAADALGRTITANAPQLEALRLAYAEQAQIAEAASSDLRQPLRNINTFVGLIGRRLTQLGAADEVADYLDFVTDGASRMNGMVDDLLRYSDARTESEPVPVDTGVVLGAIRDNLSDLLAREGARLEFPADLPTVPGHPTQVLQLFQNLISNGVKFKRPGVAPRCTIACVVEAGVARFSVSDNGIGIPANRLADVFGLFTRLHERGAYEGTGIGLATCRRIVMAAGGEIWAESLEGEGTTFVFTWPLEEGLSPKPAAAPAVAERPARLAVAVG